ncbi:MAG TPA: family 16 glycoside hydrolase [Patescibacteria group bacterium]|jgi:hypothetical protein|nr:family 16 glycoside hydrolase [Patescibacteria group bacterium]
MLWQRKHLPILALLVFLVACSGPANPQASDADILFEEAFDGQSSGSWRMEADESGTTSMTDGAMIIEISAPNMLQYTALVGSQFTEFDLGVDTAFMNSTPDSTLGLLLRMAGPDDFLRFEITADGRYMVERLNPGGSWTRYLDNWERSPALVTGFGAANRLRVVAKEAEISFFANEQLLLTLPDSATLAGQIGLDAGTFGEPGTRAAFDNLTIREP